MRRANGTGSIVYLGKKRRRPYGIRISTDVHKVMTDKGLRYRQTYKYLAYFATAREAQNYLDNLNTGKPVPSPVTASKAPTLEEVFDRWLAQKLSRKRPLADMTVNSYKAALNRFGDLKGMRFDLIRHDDLQAAFTQKSDKAASTVSHMRVVIKALYKYAIANGIVSMDYSTAIVADHEERKEVHHPFTAEEIRALWEDHDDDMRKIALILIYTGMRISEWLLMTCENIHLSDGYMVGGVKTTAGKNRIIPIHKDIIPLVDHFMQRAGTGCVYPSASGKPYVASNLNRVWRKAVPNHLTHDCRHTCATAMENAGIPLLHRKLILGHSVQDITEGRYTHVDPAILVKDINSIKFV